MDDAFTPLFPAQNPSAFSSFSKPAAQSHQPAASQPVSGHSCVKAATPLVTFRKEGDRVTQIHVECPCGQRVVLDCEY